MSLLTAPVICKASGSKPEPPPPTVLVDPCDVGLCDCLSYYVVDLAQYFVPNYTGWATAKKIWLDPSGGTNHMRFFSYAANKYELIKFGDNHASETYTVGLDMITLTAENNINGTNETRTFPNHEALAWMPRYACRNKPQLNEFDFCHDGEYYYLNCVFSYSLPAHCGTFKSKVQFLPGYNYGYNVGILDSIVKINKLDDLWVEKYYYGKSKGFLRWELINPSGAITNWAQQIDETTNSPLFHQGCFQP